MQVIHRISISATPEVRRELAAMGIVVGESGLVTFEVDEAHEAWPALRGWIAQRKAADIVSTKFSRKELAEARWLALEPDWHHGYPRPEGGLRGFREAVYELTDSCEQCGMGLRQKAPFQMKSEPKWGRNGILQLNWVFDEFFVTPEVWSTVFEPNGIGCRPVLDTKGAELRTVVQLVAEEEVEVVAEGLAAERCGSCGRVKYLPVARGAFPALANEPSRQMVRTKVYFGSGAAAHRRVVISQAVASALVAAKVRGASVRPVMERPVRN